LRRVRFEIDVLAVEELVRAIGGFTPEALNGAARIDGLGRVDPDQTHGNGIGHVDPNRVAVDDAVDCVRTRGRGRNRGVTRCGLGRSAGGDPDEERDGGALHACSATTRSTSSP
jgi:hypothetical protein